ncbi:MAG: hypothetical protein KDD69_04600 [Bdellovibrionales bacterium]|nr:hypothetical protein [Bdellovibrionales bacterium]
MRKVISFCVVYLLGALTMALICLLEPHLANQAPAPRPPQAAIKDWDGRLRNQLDVRQAIATISDPSRNEEWLAASERLRGAPEEAISVLLPALQEAELDENTERVLVETLTQLMKDDVDLRAAVERSLRSLPEKAQQRVRTALANSESLVV